MRIQRRERKRIRSERAQKKRTTSYKPGEGTLLFKEKTGYDILSLLKSLSKDRLVIVVSHDEEFARTFGDRVLEMSDGLIVADSAAS